MASNKDGGSSKSGSKPSDTSPADKKPKPLIDLKATEVRKKSGDDKADDKTASTPTSSLKGAPDNKTAASSSAGTAAASSPKGSVPSSGSGRSDGEKTSSSASGAAAQKETSEDGKSSSGGAGSGGTTAATGAAAAAATTAVNKPSSSTPPSSSSSGSSKPAQERVKASGDTASAASTSSSGGGGAEQPPSGGDGGNGGKKASGGGFVSTLSYLAAAVIGGFIALFAAEPLQDQFGIALTSSKVPTEVEERLAAVEASQTAASGEADQRITGRIEALTQSVDANSKRLARLAKLENLEERVSKLAADVEKARSAPTGAAEEGAGSADRQALSQRLSKLESALSTLSSATGSDGKSNGLAPMAQFSAKFADLESSLGSQMSALRKSLMGELDKRVAGSSDAAAKAVAGAERLNRDVAEMKTETARIEQRTEVLKAASDKLANTMRAVREQAAELKVELDDLKGEVKQELAKVVRPDDVEQALGPVKSKVEAIEKDLGAIIASESARKKNAERIVLSLELANLKRALDRGVPYEAELKDVKRVAGDALDFEALEAHSSEGVASSQALSRQFQSVAYKMINAAEQPKDASRIDRLFSAAKSIVQVRRTDVPEKANTTEAAVARIEKHLKDGDMAGALAIAEKLPEDAKKSAQDWLSQLTARANVDQAIARIEDQLKASLGGTPQGKG